MGKISMESIADIWLHSAHRVSTINICHAVRIDRAHANLTRICTRLALSEHVRPIKAQLRSWWELWSVGIYIVSIEPSETQVTERKHQV